MVRTRGKDDGGAMNDTTAPPTPPGAPPPPHEPPPGPPPGGQSGPPPGGEAPRAGMNTAALGDYRSLRRSAHDRKIAGVAGGLARHLDVDPLLVRVLLVVLAFFGGAGILLYGALWLLVPDERDGHVVVPSDDSTRNVLVIVALVVAALVALTTGVGGDSGGVWFLSVVAVGALAFHLLRQSRRQRETYAGPVGPGGPVGTGGAVGPAGPAPAPPPGTPAGYGSWAPAPAYPPAPRRRRGPLLFMPTLALVALGAGVLGLLDSNGWDVPDAAYAALALATVGTMLVVGSFFGRAGGLVLLGLVSLGALGATALAEPSYDGDRDVVHRPTTTAELEDTYFLPAGRIVLDLTELSEPSALAGRTIELDVNAGEIVVIVPGQVDIDLDAEIRYGGAIDTPDGRTYDGWGTDLQRTFEGPPEVTGPPLELDLETGFGHIDVRRG
jgi:phage shock protein PspC (stress-responsive transcriptional regulator)